jgi:hypothetical protein
MQFNLPLHNNPGERRKQKINPKRVKIIMKIKKTQNPPPIADKKPQRKPKFPCLICGDDHYTRNCPHRDEVAKLFKGNSQPVVLTQPFPQKQSKVSQALTPPAGGNANHPPSEEASLSDHIYVFNGID